MLSCHPDDRSQSVIRHVDLKHLAQSNLEATYELSHGFWKSTNLNALFTNILRKIVRVVRSSSPRSAPYLYRLDVILSEYVKIICTTLLKYFKLIF